MFQKEPPRGVLSKICSENMQHIYGRTPTPKCFAIILRHGCSPVNLLHIFRTPFTTNISGWLLPCLKGFWIPTLIRSKCLTWFWRHQTRTVKWGNFGTLGNFGVFNSLPLLALLCVVVHATVSCYMLFERD